MGTAERRARCVRVCEGGRGGAGQADLDSTRQLGLGPPLPLHLGRVVAGRVAGPEVEHGCLDAAGEEEGAVRLHRAPLGQVPQGDPRDLNAVVRQEGVLQPALVCRIALPWLHHKRHVGPAPAPRNTASTPGQAPRAVGGGTAPRTWDRRSAGVRQQARRPPCAPPGCAAGARPTRRRRAVPTPDLLAPDPLRIDAACGGAGPSRPR